MDKTTKTKIIVFASFGIFVLLVLVIVMALSGSDDDENMQDVNTSLRGYLHISPKYITLC